MKIKEDFCLVENHYISVTNQANETVKLSLLESQ